MDTFIIVTAHNEADNIEATLAGLARAFPGAPVWVADDGSTDETARIARRTGARVVRSERPIGKGGAATLAAHDALTLIHGQPTVIAPATSLDSSSSSDSAKQEGQSVAVLCDADLGESASLLGPLVDAVRDSHAELATAVFAKRVGGGLGLVVGFARWAIRRRCDLELEAPVSGQRALRASALEDVLPFAHGFGMEVGMTIDAARAGHRVLEIPLDLQHRATGRTIAGFAHRGRQLLDCFCAYRARP